MLSSLNLSKKSFELSKYDQAAKITVAYSLCMASKSFETNRVRILRVQLYIEEHLDGDLSVERLADVTHLSPFHFHRIFRANVGEGVAEYVRRIRIEAAAIALKSTSDSVTTIALDAGYGSHEAFTRAFRRRFGVSPLDCRNNHLLNAKEQETRTMSGEITTREVRIETIEPQRVAFLRFVGPYEDCGPTFDRLMGWAGPRGLLKSGTKVLAICHDDPDVTPEDKLRLDCCFTVSEYFEAVDDLQGADDSGRRVCCACASRSVFRPERSLRLALWRMVIHKRPRIRQPSSV